MAVVVTLALGIGANSAVFSVIDAVLLRPPPFPDGDRLVRLSQVREAEGDVTGVAPVRLEEWSELSTAFEAITGYYVEDVSDTTGELPDRVRQATVAPRFLDVWRIDPVVGRGFTDEEHLLGGPGAVLISDRYRQARFTAGQNVLEQTVTIDGQTYSVVGVMPPSFRFPVGDVDLWIPHPVDAPFAQSREATWFSTVARLRPDVAPGRARVNIDGVQAGLAARYGGIDGEIGVSVEPLNLRRVADVAGSMWLLYGAVSLLLLVACVNVAALFLSRAAERHRDLSVRESLGASPFALVAQTLTEPALLTLTGAAASFLVAGVTLRVLRILAPGLPRLDEIGIDPRTVVYTMAAAIVVALICGLFPAIRSRRLTGHLAGSGRGHLSQRFSLQWTFVGVQVALSVALLSGAGLLLRSFEQLGRVDPGFDPANVLAFRLSADFSESADWAGVLQRLTTTLDELESLPGVGRAALAYSMPGVAGARDTEFSLVDGADRTDASPSVETAEFRPVSPSYFDVMRIPLLAGELCARPSTPAVTQVMVNRAFADRYLAERSAIGVGLASGNDAVLRIAGVVGNARESGIDRRSAPVVYPCSAAMIPQWFLLRTDRDPITLVDSVRRRLAEVAPFRSVYDVTTVEEEIGDAFAQDRLSTTLLSAFAVTALALVCVGVYGTLSYLVNVRRREVGMRVALGAQRSRVVSSFLLKVMYVVAISCAAGIGLSFAFSRLLSGMLYGVSSWDATTLSSVVGMVTVVAAMAAWLPARRASVIDPMQALREE